MGTKPKPFMALKGRIVEEGYNYKSLSTVMGKSAKFISNRVSGKIGFTISDTYAFVSALNIEPKDVNKYFFPTCLG